MVWVLRLVAVDVLVLTIWMFVDGPRVATIREVVGYAGESNNRYCPGVNPSAIRK